MPTWIIILAIILQVFSFFWMWMLMRDTEKFLNSQISILGEENKAHIKSRKIKIIKSMYFAFILVWLPITVFALLFNPNL